MSYNTAIRQQDVGFIGEIIKDNVVIYTSPNFSDPVAVSRNLSEHFKTLAEAEQPIKHVVNRIPNLSVSETVPAPPSQEPIIPSTRPVYGAAVPQVFATSSTPVVNNPPVRRCCGRG
jgi:hypothetical protein